MVTASIVVHKTPEDQLLRAIDCIMQSSIDKLYILDNSPTEELKGTIPENPEIIYKKINNNGYGAGHNIAIKEAMKSRSDYHLVMNADVAWEGDIILRLKDYMDMNPKIGMISPKVYYPDGDLQYTCRMLPTPIDLIFKRFLPEKIIKRRMEKYLLTEHDHNKPINCPYLLGSFLFFRIKALEESGIFDERFFMYPEDIDITRRIHENWETLYWPEVKIIHEHQAASRKSMKMLGIHLKNMIKYFNKWGWIYDKKRKEYNLRLRKSMIPLPREERPKGRG
ncbi:MAG: glycosyltransferase family 2 protein [Muribaculaceae bacterium]|nr:glycosyltransferase family 2 protein [Muribaculaceae bacterium]